MAAAGDLRDIMDMPHEGPRKPAPKKTRGAPQPRLSGISKEVYSLMGDSVPPIPIEQTPKYKSRPAYAPRAFKPRKWEPREFVNGARKDGLVLRHWKHAVPTASGQSFHHLNEVTSAGIAYSIDENSNQSKVAELRYEDEFPMEKFNVKIGVATYKEEQYEKNFKSEDWTKQETDFLINLCHDFDLRWILIADRYVPQEIPLSIEQSGLQTATDADVMAVDTVDGLQKRSSYPERSMEALKARYYDIAAKMLETHTPANDMTQSEFQLWEKMRNFDAKTEIMRKQLAEKLFERTKDEAEEEKILLEELARITKNEEEFLTMRRDLYSRLEPPPTMRRNGEEQSTAMYQTSSGLSALLQNLLAREKKFKRPSMMTAGPDGGHGSSSTTPGLDADGQPKKQKWEKGQHPNQYTRRDTMDTQNSETQPQKKGSQSGPNIRVLSPAEELKFGISHPQERLTSGVQFRHEKVHRLVTGKSAVQMQKYQAALIELGIPTRLVMPTDKVCKEFERLITEIQVLLDARKTSEKVTSEIKVLEEQRRIRLGLPKEEGDQDAGSEEKMDIDATAEEAGKQNAQADVSMLDNDNDNVDEADDVDADGDGEDEDDTNMEVEAETQDRDEDEEDVQAELDEEEEDNVGNDDEDNGAPDVEDVSDADEDSKLVGQEPEDVVGSEQEEEESSRANSDDEAVESDNDDENDNDEEDNALEMGSDNQDGGEAEEPEDLEEPDEPEDSDEADDSDDSKQAEPTPAPSTTSRVKRSASVVSDASKTGSNRSMLGRKKRR